MMGRKKRIGLMTCGANTPGINAAVRAAARTIFKNGCDVINIENGFDGLIDTELISIPHWSFFKGLLYKGGSVLGLPRMGNPFEYPIIRENRIEYIDKSELIVDNVREFKLHSIVMIGGIEDIETAQRLSEKGISFHIIPNCITNDFMEADITFGFKTAVQTTSNALDRLHTTAESHHRVFVVEVIGDHSGWLALESAVTGGADVILIPEKPFHIENIITTLEKRKKQSTEFSLIVAATGATPAEPGKKPNRADLTSFLISELKKNMELEIRSLNMKLIQLGGGPIAFDRLLASYYGYGAANNACHNADNSCITVYTNRIKTIPLKDVKLNIKKVPSDHILIDTASHLGISLGTE